MGDFTKRLKHRGTDLVTKEELVVALSQVLPPLTRQMDALTADLRVLAAAFEELRQALPPETP